MVDVAQRQRTTFPDAREQFIASTHGGLPDQLQQRRVDNLTQQSQNLIRKYESHQPHHGGKMPVRYETPQVFPDWVTESPNAFEMMNEWSMPGGESWMGSPMWMDARNKVNKNFGLPGTEVAKSWKRKFQEGLVDPWLEPLLEGLGVNLQPDPEDLITVDELPVTPLEGSIMPEDETEDLLDEYETEDLLDEDEGYFWEPLGGTQVAGTTEEKWGQLVRDGVVNPGDSLNPLQIDQLYNQHYEDGVGDMDQFGVV